eukprot:338304-Amorphochlora_amoeboformis.AAC.3
MASKAPTGDSKPTSSLSSKFYDAPQWASNVAYSDFSLEVFKGVPHETHSHKKSRNILHAYSHVNAFGTPLGKIIGKIPLGDQNCFLLGRQADAVDVVVRHHMNLHYDVLLGLVEAKAKKRAMARAGLGGHRTQEG